MMRATIACRHMEGIVRVMQKPENRRKIRKSIFALLPRKQKSGFFLILLILAVSAARKASIAADIEQLEGGYQFVLAEGGTNLSGGQRQRIALARIFLKKPSILILDEATSALDNTSEKRIQAEIEKMKEECGTTVLSIAHRLSPCKTATRSSSWTRVASCSGAPAASRKARRAVSGHGAGDSQIN